MASKTAVERAVRFPFSEALRFSIESIRKRFTRALLTLLSIVLGIAFMDSLLTMSSVLTVAAGEATIQAYHYWLAVISLLVCTVGIVNSMLMAVTERYKEIGTLKCLGAMDRNILLVFLLEAGILGLVGGLIGSLAGTVATTVIYGIQIGWDKIALVPPAEYLRNILYGLSVAVFLSVVASLYPAYYASKLDPAVALRYEV